MLPLLYKRPDLRCKAKAKHTGEQCMNIRAYSTTVCRFHGARRKESIIRGADHHFYTHGHETRGVRTTRAVKLKELKIYVSLLKLIDSKIN
jgi:hypothetical protein